MKTIGLLRLASAGLCAACPSLWGATLSEDFASSPVARGWVVTGGPALFRWNSAEQALDVTWDSSQPNSYFALSLGRTLGRYDDFSITFDLNLRSFQAGFSPGKSSIFPVSIGLVNLARATTTNFLHGTGMDSPDLVEFSFFPDPGGSWQWGPSMTASLIDSTGVNWSRGGLSVLGLESNTVYRVSLSYTGSNQVLKTVVTRGGAEYAVLSQATLGASFTDFRVDHFAVCSYSDAGQSPEFAGSIRAEGVVDNVSITTSEPLIARGFSVSGARTELRVPSRANWQYSLQRTTDLANWVTVSSIVPGTGAELSLTDTNPSPVHGFYRVKAERSP